jgi:hypothetical protein
MHLLGLPQLPAMFTLSDRPPLLLDFKEESRCVSAGGRPMAFDASLASKLALFDENLQRIGDGKMSGWRYINKGGSERD